MKGIKLTPFLLFLILLVVLVIAMIFGYYSKPILESMTSGTSSDNWVVAGKTSIQFYNAGTPLDLILSSTSTDVPGYYFDPKNGNVIVTNDIESESFVLITRESQGVPTTVTSGYTGSRSPSGENTTESMATPWSYYDGTMSLLYAPYQSSTLVILINNGTNEILSIYKNINGDGQILETTNLNGGAQTGITADADLSLYSRLGSPVNDSIIIGQENVSALKIQENVYYSSDKGIIVGKSGTLNDQSLSSDYMNGVSKQNNGGSSEPSTILVLSCMVDQTHILVAIIVKVGSKYQIASSNIVSQQATSGKDSSDDNFAISITTNGNDNTLGNQSSSSSTNSTNGSSSSKDDKEDDESCEEEKKTKHRCSTSITNKGEDSDYIKKTEIVPPVCPACPTTNCPISINSSGKIVDCTGKEVNMGQITSSSPGSYSSAPQTIAGAIGGTAEQTVKSVGDTVQTGLTEAGDTLQTGLQVAAPALESTVNTAGDVLEKGLDTAGGALDSVIGGTENIVGKVGEGLGDVGQGASDLIQGVSGDVASLGKDAAGLVYGAGQGAYDLTAREQDLEQQKLQLEKEKKEFEDQKNQQQQQGQQGQQGQQQQQEQQGYSYYNQQLGYDYNQQQCCYQPQYGQGYSHPRTCSSNFMPITNDFSQFT